MSRDELVASYEGYIACLNAQDWPSLGRYVGEDVRHNGHTLGLSGYRAMLVDDYRKIPDLSFVIAMLVADPPYIAARLAFDCTPAADFLGVAVNGRRVRFAENVFYEFRDGRISDVWSVIDKGAIEAEAAKEG